MINPFRSDPGKVDRLLAQFPGPICLPASAIPAWTLMAAGPAVAILFGCLATSAYLKRGSTAVGGGVILTFVGIAAGLLLVLVGKKCLKGSLRLDRDGFIENSIWRYRWCDVSDFAGYGNGRVAFAMPTVVQPHLVGGAYWPGMDPTPSIVPTAPEFNPLLMPRDLSMSDTYGFPTNDLTRLMNDWRQLALQTNGPDYKWPNRLPDVPRSMRNSYTT